MSAYVNADAFVPQLWDAAVYRTLEDTLVAKKICRNMPTNPAKGFGDTVYFNGLADPTVNDYTGTVTYETLISSQIPLLINQRKYAAFKVGDIEAAMANVDMKGSQAARVAYVLQKAVDTYIFGSATAVAVAGAGTTATADTTCDSTTILSDISGMIRILEEQNVRANNIWIVIPPWVKEKLVLAGIKFQIKDGLSVEGGVEFANYLGADIYVSNNVYNSNTATDPVSTVCAGSYDSIVYSEALMESRGMELESSFDYGVSSLLVFGAEVIKPKELVKRVMTYTAETAI